LSEDKGAGRNLFHVKEFPAKMLVSVKLEAALTSAGIGDFRTIDV